MTNAEVVGQIERADRLREELHAVIAATIVDPNSLCAEGSRRGLYAGHRGSSTRGERRANARSRRRESVPRDVRAWTAPPPRHSANALADARL